MLKPLLVMALAYILYAAFVIVLRMKTELLVRKIEAAMLMRCRDSQD